MALDTTLGLGFDWLASGEENIERIRLSSVTNTPASGVLRLCYFTARKTETISQIRCITGTTAAAPTPTLCKMGVWSEAANGDLTLVGGTANDTTLFAAASTAYVRNLTASFTKRAGTRYALATLVVTAAAAPSFTGVTPQANSELFTSPKIAAQITGQTDLPASIANGSLGLSGIVTYFNLLP